MFRVSTSIVTPHRNHRKSMLSTLSISVNVSSGSTTSQFMSSFKQVVKSLLVLKKSKCLPAPTVYYSQKRPSVSHQGWIQSQVSRQTDILDGTLCSCDSPSRHIYCLFIIFFVAECDFHPLSFFDTGQTVINTYIWPYIKHPGIWLLNQPLNS